MKPKTLKTVSLSLVAFGVLALIAFIYSEGVAIDRSRSISCASNMKAICFAARLWANDRSERMPTNFTCMSDEVITPKVRHCPADNTNPRVNEWADFTETGSSYVIESPGAKEGTTNLVFIRCRIHGHVGFPDGSVMNASRTTVFRKI